MATGQGQLVDLVSTGGCMDATWRGRNGDGGVKTMGQLDNGTAVNQTRIRVDRSLFPNRILKPVGWT